MGLPTAAFTSSIHYSTQIEMQEVASRVYTSLSTAYYGGVRISMTLTTDGVTPAANLSGLKWAFFDATTPDAMGAPTDKGATGYTDAAGLLTLNLPNSSKVAGQVGWLSLTNSDGTPGQSPAAKAFSGPVAVS